MLVKFIVKGDDEWYATTYDELVSDGVKASTRGRASRESANTFITFIDPATAFPGVRAREAAIAAACLVSGTADLARLLEIGVDTSDWDSIDPPAFNAPYGPRAKKQYRAVQSLLADDPESRRGVVTIWDQRKDFGSTSKHVPCTLSQQFVIRDGRLSMLTTLRSSDIEVLPIDIAQNAIVLLTMAKALNTPTGELSLAIGSLHVYEDRIDEAAALVSDSASTKLFGFGKNSGGAFTWGNAETRAKNALYGRPARGDKAAEWVADLIG